jgi:hypothetical protein
MRSPISSGFVVQLLHAARRLLGRERRDLLENRVGIFVARPQTFEVQTRKSAQATDLDCGRRRDNAVHRCRHHRQLELVRVDLPRDVDVFGIARAATRHNRDVVEAVCPSPRLADPDLDFHGPSGVLRYLERFRISPERRESGPGSRSLAETDRVGLVGAVTAVQIDVRV